MNKMIRFLTIIIFALISKQATGQEFENHLFSDSYKKNNVKKITILSWFCWPSNDEKSARLYREELFIDTNGIVTKSVLYSPYNDTTTTIFYHKSSLLSFDTVYENRKPISSAKYVYDTSMALQWKYIQQFDKHQIITRIEYKRLSRKKTVEHQFTSSQGLDATVSYKIIYKLNKRGDRIKKEIYTSKHKCLYSYNEKGLLVKKYKKNSRNEEKCGQSTFTYEYY